MACCSTLSYGLRTADKFGVRERMVLYSSLNEAAIMTKPINVPFYNIQGRKNAAGRSPRRSCSCMTMPPLTGHLQPRRNCPTLASIVLISHPILRIWPRRTTTCSLDWKNNWEVAIFRPTRTSLLLRTPGWTDYLLIFFWVACKS